MALRLLIKAHPSATRGKLGATGPGLQLTPLLPSIERGRKVALGAAAKSVWHLATADTDAVNPWDACHQLMRGGLGFAGQAGVAFAEPDLEQSWLWTTERRQALGLTGECDKAEPQDSDVYAMRHGTFRG